MEINKSLQIKWGIIFAAIAAVMFAGELLLEGLIEFADLILELTQAVLTHFYENVFELEPELAQHRAAWTSMITLILLLLVTGRIMAPRVLRKFIAMRAAYRQQLADAKLSWRALPWYKKIAYGSIIATVLLGALMIL